MGVHINTSNCNHTSKMNTKIVLLFAFVCAASGRVFILDDAEFDTAPVYRVRRDAPPGRVGPVYTFVKTDPQANFKWGVRHRAGAQYGKRSAPEEVADPVEFIPVYR